MTSETELHPLSVAVHADLDDLQGRLARTRWADEVASRGWGCGVACGYVRELAECWRTGYEWRKDGSRLNEHPQFTTSIDATGQASPPTPGLAKTLMTVATEIVEPLRQYGAHAPALTPEADDDEIAALLRYLGRRPMCTGEGHVSTTKELP